MQPFMLETNPKDFLEATHIDDPQERATALGNRLEDCVCADLLRLLLCNDDAHWERAASAWQALVRQEPDDDRRYHIYRVVRDILMNALTGGALPLLPAFRFDTSPIIVATAALDLLAMSPSSADDPQGAARVLVRLVEEGKTANRGAAYGGLLHYGNAKVCDMLWEIREALDLRELEVAAQCQSAYTVSPVIEFALRWMESFHGKDCDEYGVAAVLLARQAQRTSGPDWISDLLAIARAKRAVGQSSHQAVEDAITSLLARIGMGPIIEDVLVGDRPLPVVGVELPQGALTPVPVEEYAHRIEPRLRAIADEEPAPHIMPLVLKAWGLS